MPSPLLLPMLLAATAPTQDLGQRALTSADFSSRAPAWSPDGSRIAFETDHGGSWDIDVLDLGSSQIHHVTTGPGDERLPAWSPDGRRLVFVNSERGEPDLTIFDVETGESEPIQLPGHEIAPHWSPDGGRIAFTSLLSNELRLRSYDLETESVTDLLPVVGRDVGPRWSPSGSRIAFFSRRETGGLDDEIYLLDVIGGVLHRLTVGPGHDFGPAWAPDGRRLVFVSVEPDGSRWLQVVDDEGNHTMRLGQGFFRVTEPAWTPDGRRIVYAARTDPNTPYRLFVENIPTSDPPRTLPKAGPVRGGAALTVPASPPPDRQPSLAPRGSGRRSR